MDDSVRREDRKNKEQYSDPTVYEAMKSTEKKQKAYYCFKTMISVARLAGFFVTQALVIEDKEGNKYNSDKIVGQVKKG